MSGLWGETKEIRYDDLYKASFGDMPDETVYEDGFGKILTIRKGDQIVMEDDLLHKAVNVGAASGSAGYAFTPIVWDTDVVDVTRKLTPLLTLVPKVTNRGMAAYYYRITARGAAAWGDEDPALEETDDTKKQENKSIKFLRIVGRVTGVAQIAGAHFESSMQREVLNKTQSINEAIEQAMLVGDSATDQFTHDGLQKMLVTTNGATQTNIAGAVTLSNAKKLVSDCFNNKGAPNLMITDTYTADHLIEQQMDYVRNVDPNVTVAWGLQLPAIQTVVGKIPIMVSQFMPTTSTERRLFCVNTNYLQQRVLQDITFERLAKTSDSEKFLLKTYRTFVNKFPEGMGQLYGISD